MQDVLEDSGKAAWVGFKAVCANFVGNLSAENYREIIDNMLRAYKTWGVIYNWKHISFIPTWTFIPPNLWAESDERKDIHVMERRYRGQWSFSMLAGYFWQLIRDVPDVFHKRKPSRNCFIILVTSNLFFYISLHDKSENLWLSRTEHFFFGGGFHTLRS